MFLLLLFLTLATAQCQVNDSLNESLTTATPTLPVVETPIVIELTASPPLSDSPSTLTPTVPEVIEDIPSTPSLKNESFVETAPPPDTIEPIPTQENPSERDDYGLYPFPLVPPTEAPTNAPSTQEKEKGIPIPIPIRGQTPTSSASHASPYLAILLCLLTQIMSFIT